MKILVKGNINDLKEAKFECPRCGCVFVANEMEYHVFGKIDDCYILEHDCPCCGISIQVDDDRKHWEIDINTLEDLLELETEVEHPLIISSGDLLEIEIYDNYRE